MSENLRTYTKALYGFDAVMQRADGTGWGNASPCAEWTAADVVAHNIGMCHMVAGFARGVGSKGPDHDTGGGLSERWNAARDEFMEAFDQSGALQQVVETPWGEMPADRFLGFAWADPLVHTYDLAVALGQPVILDEGLAATAARNLAAAGDSIRGPGRFGPAVEVADDADPVTRLVAVTGRKI